MNSLIRSILLIPSLIRLLIRSLASRIGLVLLNLFGIVLAVALLSSASFFAQGVDRAILQQELETLTSQTGRDAFSLRVYIFPSARRPLSTANAEEVADNLAGTLSGEIGLPPSRQGIQVESGNLMLLPPTGDTRYADPNGLLNTVNAVYIEDVADHLTVAAGDPFVADAASADAASAGEVMDVWMHESLAAEMGLDPGESFRVGFTVSQPFAVVRVAGFWRAADPQSSFWFKNPDSSLKSALLVNRADYIRFIEPVLPARARAISWYITLDDATLNPSRAVDYVTGFDRAMTIIDRYLPDARLDISPLAPLQDFVGRQSVLTTMLLAFNLPSLIFLIYFLLLVAGIIAGRQQREIAVLRSRGMSKSTLFSLTLLEQALLFVVAAPLGIAAGMGLARLMGNTASFLSFAPRPPLPVSLQGLDWRLVAIGLLVALLARLVPVLNMARATVIEQERAHSRQTGRPFWQRIYLDFILVAPTVYVYRQLLLRGSFVDPNVGGPEGLFQDPLLVLAPALFVVTAALLVMRFFPLLMTVLDWLAGRMPWLTPHLVLRQLGRHSAAYSTPLLLVIVLLAMGIYTVSMASSLDRWLVDRIYYSVGTDMRFLPYLPSETNPVPVVTQRGTFNDLPGVAATARVGDYGLRIDTSQGRFTGRFLAVDRLDLPSALWFRSDFARDSVGGLMNRLAGTPENVLVSQRFLEENALNVGDPLPMTIILDDGIRLTVTFTIAGAYGYFPTAYTEDTVIIGNLETLFLLVGSEFPHHTWLRLQPGADPDAVIDAIEARGLAPGRLRNAVSEVAVEQAKLERVGIFGTLSVGFVAAAVMATLALLVQGFASLSERGYQFGVLRAIGLMRGQVLAQVGLEYSLITAYGALGGTVVGAIAAALFSPFFRITGDIAAPLPPLIPYIDWVQIAWMATIFTVGMVLVEIIVILRSFRQRVFTTLRLGNPG